MTTAYAQFKRQRDNDRLVGITRLGRKVLDFVHEFRQVRRRLPRNSEIRHRFRFGEHTLEILLEQLEAAGLVYLNESGNLHAAMEVCDRT